MATPSSSRPAPSARIVDILIGYVIGIDHSLFQAVPGIHMILQVSLDGEAFVAHMANELAIMWIRRVDFFVVRFSSLRIAKATVTF